MATTCWTLNGLRVAQQQGGVFTWLHSDHLYSATVLTDAEGLDIRRLASGLLI